MARVAGCGHEDLSQPTDIFRVRDGKVTDHWDCTPWEPFNNIGERRQIEDQVAADQARAVKK